MTADDRPLIVTASLDARTFALADGLRRAHFPPHRNVLAAHLTLFHALPGGEAEAVDAALAEAAEADPAPPLRLAAPMSLGYGVALAVECPPLVALRARLAKQWSGWLTRQDSARWRPHVTVQNKVTPAAARQLLDTLAAGWQPVDGHAIGLALWRYDGGPWEPVRTHAFPAAGAL